MQGACVACLHPCLIDSWPLIMRGSIDALVLVAEGFEGFKGVLFTCSVLVCPYAGDFYASASSNSGQPQLIAKHKEN
jgi:hypothetical protein